MSASASTLPSDTLAADVNALASLNVAFTLLEPHLFTYTAQYALDVGTSVPGRTGGSAGLTTPNGSESNFEFFRDWFAPGRQTSVHSGVLEPGNYNLFAGVGTRDEVSCGTVSCTHETDSSAGFNVAFGLSPVPSPTPEPGTVTLLTGGLVGAFAAYRRRKSPESARTRPAPDTSLNNSRVSEFH
jgi:hypothetical protein